MLLERQRAQMADLGIPVDDRGLLDQIFGNPSAAGVSPATQEFGSAQSSGNVSSEPFEWPQVSSSRRDDGPKESGVYGYSGHTSSTEASEGRYGDASNIPWGVGAGERVGLPTPPSPSLAKRREEEYSALVEERRRLGV